MATPISLDAARARNSRARLTYAVAALAAFFAAAGFFEVASRAAPPKRVAALAKAKGGELAFLLVNEHGLESPSHFRAGERFKLFLTSGCADAVSPRVILFQGGERYAPLPAWQPPRCANLLPWPGAFVLDGRAPVDVCVAWGASAATATAAAALEHAVCTRLEAR